MPASFNKNYAKSTFAGGYCHNVKHYYDTAHRYNGHTSDGLSIVVYEVANTLGRITAPSSKSDIPGIYRHNHSLNHCSRREMLLPTI